ncbi:hypothetical protein ACEPAI_9503 [Sanghuangporus weigelae]
MHRLAVRSALRTDLYRRLPVASATRRWVTRLYAPTLEDMKSLPTHQTTSNDGGVFIMYGRNPQPGDDFVGYNFFEEPHGFTAEQGFGYLEIEFGERLGPEGHYEVLRKLGWSIRSTTWLAKDTLTGRFVAIKVLNQCTTQREMTGLSSERDVLRKISSCGEGFREMHCLSLLDDFTQPVKDDRDEEHICLVIDPLGLFSIPARAPGDIDILLLVKKLLVNTLKGIHHLHSLRIVHTGIHPSNILMDLESRPDSLNIEAFLKFRPPEKYPPEETWGGKYVQVARSQPFPPPPSEAAMSRSHILSGFGTVALCYLSNDQLKSCKGWLIDDPPRMDVDLYQINKKIGALKSVADLDGATALMKKCLRLNPKDRPSAKELLQDSWLNSGV